MLRLVGVWGAMGKGIGQGVPSTMHGFRLTRVHAMQRGRSLPGGRVTIRGGREFSGGRTGSRRGGCRGCRSSETHKGKVLFFPDNPVLYTSKFLVIILILLFAPIIMRNINVCGL